MTPEEKAKQKALRIKKAAAIKGLATTLFIERYKEALRVAPTIGSREGFTSLVINSAERSFEDAEQFFDAWKRKKGKYLSPE